MRNYNYIAESSNKYFSNKIWRPCGLQLPVSSSYETSFDKLYNVIRSFHFSMERPLVIVLFVIIIIFLSFRRFYFMQGLFVSRHNIFIFFILYRLYVMFVQGLQSTLLYRTFFLYGVISLTRKRWPIKCNDEIVQNLMTQLCYIWVEMIK